MAKALIPLFFDPPLYTLPGELRLLIKEQIEIADAEWLKRHNYCQSNATKIPAGKDIWGNGCESCFSDIEWDQIVGELEFALGAFKYLHTRRLARPENVHAALREECRELRSISRKLKKTILSCWQIAFPRRNELIEQLKGLESFEASLKLLLKASTKQEKHEKKLKLSRSTDRATFGLVGILWDILHQAGFRCELIVVGEDVQVASPGLRILQECLAEVEIEMTSNELVKWTKPR